MKEYEITINKKKYILFNSKSFTKEQLENMINQAISEMKWNGIRRTYGSEINYLCDHFNFYCLTH